MKNFYKAKLCLRFKWPVARTRSSQIFGASLKLLVILVASFFYSIFPTTLFANCYVTGISKIQHQIDMAFEDKIANPKEYRKLRMDIAQFARRVHKNQRYGGYPYPLHLGLVEKTLKDFGFTPQSGIDARRLLLAAWLHDAIEDTSATYAQIQIKYGTDMAQLVDAVSKLPKQQGISKQERTLGTLHKIVREHPLANVLKLADRIANMQFGKVQEGRILPKYYMWSGLFSAVFSTLRLSMETQG